MVRALLVTHGNLGTELSTTAQLIIGPQDGVSVLSNEELSTRSLCEAIQSSLESFGEDAAVVFVDIAGGSCLTACRAAQHDTRKIKVISGVNLPMMLEFFHYREKLPFDELIERVLSKGRLGIQAL